MCISGSFVEVNVQNGDLLGVAKVSNIFGVCLMFQKQ